MNKLKLALSGWVVASCLFACAAGPSIARADDAALFDKLNSNYSPTIVTIKFVLKVKSSMGEQENESETTGAMIDAKGLVLCSNSQIGGFSAAMKKMLARRGGDFSATPTDIKVLVGDDVEGVEGKVVARDSDLDLAWVQVKTPPSKPYAFIDFSKSTNARAGDRIFAVRRLDKYYDRSVVISEGWIAGSTKKPRDMLVPGGTIAQAQGLPAFLGGGEPVGIMITQMPDDEGDDMRNVQRATGYFLLPAGEVLKATQRARELAASGKGDSSDDSEADADSDSKKDDKKAAKDDDEDGADAKKPDAKSPADKKPDSKKDD